MSLTKKMKQDSITDSDTIKMTNQLDETFRKKLILYFQRVTELLKHFFALRQVIETEKDSIKVPALLVENHPKRSKRW